MAKIASQDADSITLDNGEHIEIAKLEDGEVIALDLDGSLIQWDADHGEIYNCGETPEQFGPHNLLPHELPRAG